MKNIFLKQKKWFALILFLIGCSTATWAKDITWDEISFDNSFTKDGFFSITIPIYEDDGADEALEASNEGKGKSKIYFGSTVIAYVWGDGAEQPVSDTYWARVELPSNDYVDRIYTSGSGQSSHHIDVYQNVEQKANETSSYTSYITLKFRMKKAALQSGGVFKVHLEINDNGGDEYSIERSSSTISALDFKAPMLGSVTAGDPGKFKVTANAYNNTGTEVKIFKSGSSTEHNSGDALTFDAREKSRSESIFAQFKMADNRWMNSDFATAQIPAYRYVKTLGTDNTENGTTKLKWVLAGDENGSNEYSAGKIVIMRAEDGGSFQELETVSSTDREYIDKTTTNKKNVNYTYQVKRQNPSNWGDFMKVTKTVTKTNKHAEVTEFTQAKLMAQRQTELTWKWAYKDDNYTVLTENSVFVLVREKSIDGKNFDVEETQELDCKEFLKGGKYADEDATDFTTCHFVDKINQSCVMYRWKLYLKPGVTSEFGNGESNAQRPATYLVPVKDAEGNVTWTDTDPKNKKYEGVNDKEVASLEFFRASRGYFGDRVELYWKMDEGAGSLDAFSVQRAEYDPETEQLVSPFTQIDVVEALSGIISYSYNDTRAVPGKIYQYLIEGSKECANEEVKTRNYTYGFTTPTGNIYGRLTFMAENGQAVPDAEVRLETTAKVPNSSYQFDGSYYLGVTNKSLLKDNALNNVSFQMFAKFDKSYQTSSNVQTLLSKGKVYSIYAKDDHLHFTVGKQTVTTKKTITELTEFESYMQITAVSAPDYIRLYINSECNDSIQPIIGSVNVAEEEVQMGKGFKGYLDEVRIWGKALSQKEVTKTFDRYIAGNEEDILAYWNFNYSTPTEFYDMANKDSKYFMNDGFIFMNNGVKAKGKITSKDEAVPSINQLSFKDYTSTDGTYYIAGIPYIGNGSLYTIIPRLGTHNFTPTKTQVTLSSGSVNHSANFVDKSAFPVSGTVHYENSTIPVQGVQFYVDGVVCSDSKGNIVQTDAKGNFSIFVPVGYHEVKAALANHTFRNGGRLLDEYGNDYNYQDDRFSTVKFVDETKVKYIGRVAGGAIQESYPVGHSLSTNNLGEGIYLQLTYENAAYTLNLNESDKDVYPEHLLPSNKKPKKNKWPKTNKVTYKANSNVIKIEPNAETGEFEAELLPINYAVKVFAPTAYKNISGNNSKLNMSNVFVQQFEEHTYVDSAKVKNEWVKTQYSDTVFYNKKQQFIARVKPTVNVEQVRGETPLKYFGEEEASTLTEDLPQNIKLYNEKENKYTLGLPVFTQGDTYKLKASVYEEYKYYDIKNDPTGTVDKVPSQDAKIFFQTTMASSNGTEEVEADSTGVAYWQFMATKVDLTSAVANINVRATVGNEDNATSLAWTSPFDADNKVITLGSVAQGNDFVTAGPDKLLAVLRDPPGSNSFSYLEKGTTFTESSNYTGGITQEGSENLTTNVGYELVTFTGTGVGTIQSVEQTNGITVNLDHSEEWTNSHTKTSTTTINTRFETSSDPDYVGAMGDVFLGYSTNLSYGAAESIALMTKDRFKKVNQNAYTRYEIVKDDEKQDYVLVRMKSTSVGTNFATLFAYPVVHIETRLLPELIRLKESFLHQVNEKSEDRFQAEANATKQPVYVSYLTPDDENYGRSNLDSVFKKDPKYYTNGGQSVFDGPSYKIYFPTDMVQRKDTINSLAQSIDAWTQRLADNEAAKVKAIKSGEVLQNFSFQAGATIEYSKAFSNIDNRTNNFTVVIGGGVSGDVEFAAAGSGFVLEYDEKVGTTQGGEWQSEEEATVTTGFVLADEGNDYLTVDVYQEGGGKNEDITVDDVDAKDLNLSTFIFYTRAGATGCPYEDEIKTQYFQPGTVISEKTLPVEAPEIAVENAFIENVPSGEPAYVKLLLRNNSAVFFDAYYDLIINDSKGAGLKMDGGAISNGRSILIPAGETVTKILEVTKGKDMNYDDISLSLVSQCQNDPTANFAPISDTVTVSVHYTPSCSDIKLASPAKNWTYNTDMPTAEKDNIEQHYMNVKLSDFNVNYDNFKCIRLMYKPSSESDENWITLMTYFNDQKLYDQAVKQNLTAEMIKPEDKGVISYRWFLDDMPDQQYDLCAVTVCDINNLEVENFSEVHSGIKDMYRPRLFGNPQPANGILTIKDDAKITFNEPIAAGYLTQNNFEVTGIKNGSKTDHSVAVEVDGNDTFVSELKRSMRGKDITFEAWINIPSDQNATIFEHGSDNEKISLGITKDRKLTATVNDKVYTSESVSHSDYLKNWSHVAMVLDQAEDGVSNGRLTLYYNFKSCLEKDNVPAYTQSSTYTMARNLVGQIHNIRLWTAARTSGDIQTQSNILLSGNEANLLSYYPMDEAQGNVLKDKARGLNLAMNGGKWILPEAKALALNGSNSFVKHASGSNIVIDKFTDYTMELWFKGEGNNANSTLMASGQGNGNDFGGSENLFFLGFENGKLTYKNNKQVLEAKGDYLDGNWHHVAVAANRTTQRIQIYVDGALNNYADATEYGQIAAPYIYIGTTPVRDGNLNTIYKNYFNGSVDDVRFWNLYKNENSVKAGMNNKLDGTEMGLLSYLPFEEHRVTSENVPYISFSLADTKVPGVGQNKNVDATAVLGSIEFPEINQSNKLNVEKAFMAALTAPVKDKGGVVDLLFDFVVNNDALIVTMKEDAAKIEKTTINITVSNIRDLNGNKVSSPVTWTIYVDRNQLKWGEDEINLGKDLDEPLEFTVDIVNKGGFSEDYTISNNPSWMTVEPVHGTLTATQSAHINFTISESVNIGTYNEVIYLTNSEGVTEALNVNLKVNGEKPSWRVNPAAYKYNMNIYGQLKIDNKFSNDSEDILAAFENNVCVGVATNQYIRVNDMYYVLLTVYSNVASHKDLGFKMWDASTGRTYVASPATAIDFNANTIVGSPKSPVVFNNLDLVQLDLKLNNGWTWTSFNVTNDDMNNVSDLLKYNRWINGDEIKREDGGVATYGSREGWIGSLKSFDNKGMFMFRSSYQQTLTVIGKPVNTATSVLKIKSVNKNNVAIWNYIPYLAQYNLPLNEALAGYDAIEGDVIKSQTSFAMYNNSLGWIGSLEYMQPGQGYMLQRVGTTEATLQYPSNLTHANRSLMSTRAGQEEEVEELGYLNDRYARTMSVLATVTGIEVKEGDVLNFYSNGELRGKSPVICRDNNQQALFFASIAGESNEVLDVTVERDNEIVGSVAGWSNFEADEVRGNFAHPTAIEFTATENETVYPSPFEDELFIQSNVDPDATVNVTITDMTGAVIAMFDNCNTNGQVNIHWTGAAKCTAGVYLVNIKVNDESKVYKVVKINR